MPLSALLRPLRLAVPQFTKDEVLTEVNRRGVRVQTPQAQEVQLGVGTSVVMNGEVTVLLKYEGRERRHVFQAYIRRAEAKKLWKAMTGNPDVQTDDLSDMEPPASAKTVNARNAGAVVGALLQIVGAPQGPVSFLQSLKRREGPYANKLSRASLAEVLVTVMEATSRSEDASVPSAKTVDRILKEATDMYPDLLPFLFKQLSHPGK